MIDTSIQPSELVRLIPQPAFIAREGLILQANPAAEMLLLTPGTDIRPMLSCGEKMLMALDAGSLCAALVVSGTSYPAAIRKTQEGHLFLLDDAAQELQALSLAARQLRTPLSAVMDAADGLSPLVSASAPNAPKLIRDMKRGLLQLLRIVGNMSDAQQYLLSPMPFLEPTGLIGFLDEMMEKVAALTESLGVSISFVPLPKDVTVWMDRQQMARCIYNLLSNALRFTPRGGSIRVSLHQTQNHAIVRILDSGEGLNRTVQEALFSRYLRAPAVEDSRYGMGLGLLLTRLIASAHGGAVLICPVPGGTEVAVSIRLGAPEESRLSAPDLRVDYTGQWDQTLVELSGELPDDAFDYL